jgi:hypothetical protein
VYARVVAGVRAGCGWCTRGLWLVYARVVAGVRAGGLEIVTASKCICE